MAIDATKAQSSQNKTELANKPHANRYRMSSGWIDTYCPDARYPTPSAFETALLALGESIEWIGEMKMATLNAQFLNAVDAKTQNAILSFIAKHYGIDTVAARSEVCGPEAEHLLEYLTGRERAATSVLMQRHGFR